MLAELLGRKNALLIGVDIGSHSIKSVLLENTDAGYKLLQCAIDTLPKDAVNERDLQDIEAIGKVLSRLRKKFPKQYKQVSVAVSGSTVITKTIFMDASFSDDELASQIEIEADSLIPYPIEEVSLDFERMGENAADPSKVNILLSAARTESVESRVAALEIAGWSAKVVDVESYALSRAYDLCQQQVPEECQDGLIGVVDIGANMTLMSVMKSGEILYTRDQSFGGDVYTKNIINYYGKTPEEAELAKQNAELPEGYQFEVLAPFQTAVVQQIRRAIQMFLTAHTEEKLDFIILSGGTALVEGIQQIIEDELGIACAIAEPISNLEIDSGIDLELVKKHEPKYMVAAGLAMRSFSECHI